MVNQFNFTATQVGFDENDDSLVVTLGSYAESYLMLQRHPKNGHPDDDGIYIEIDDQFHSWFDIVETCCLSTSAIRVTLSKPLKGFVELNTSLDLKATEMIELQQMLSRIFAGREDRLIVEGVSN